MEGDLYAIRVAQERNIYKKEKNDNESIWLGKLICMCHGGNMMKNGNKNEDMCSVSNGSELWNGME